jgi:hypothetical protein
MSVAVIDAGIAIGWMQGRTARARSSELGGRLHTTDAELVGQLRGTRLPITHY